MIQAGGESTRMGADKGLLPFQGTTMVEYILAQLDGLASDVAVISNTPGAYEFLNLPVYSDVIPDWGALGGIYSALYHSNQPYCLLLACDMPFVVRPFLKYLLALAPSAHVVIPRLQLDEYTEPFRAVYHTRCLPIIKQKIDAGERRVVSFIPYVNVRYVDRDEIQEFDPEFLSFFNANTPQDLEAAARIAANLNIN